MYNKRWIFKKQNKQTTDEEEIVRYISSKYGMSGCAAELCVRRGVKTKADADVFFNPSAETMSDPFAMKGMEEAVERISEAVDNGEIITIYGDYDADGITATSILYTFLTQQTEATVYFRIPNRFSEGYGMSKKAIEEIREDGTTLIVTVDCGIKNTEEIEYAAELGMDVVVTDHHTRGDVLPLCCAIVNPVLEEENSPVKYLCGAGVSYKLCEALAGVFGCSDEELYPLLALAATGTLGDSVSLTRENRTMVLCGLSYIRQGYNKGINALAENEKCSDVSRISARDISFTIVPKINAAGRMGDASRALELLTTPDMTYARELAHELTEDNEKRKKTESDIFAESVTEEHVMSKPEDCITVALGEGWHHGVIGIVAARLAEKYGKPAFVFATEKDDPTLARGSARSVEGFDLRDALSHCEDTLVKYGGHEMAAGLTVKVENIAKFIFEMNYFNTEIRKKTGPEIRTQKVDVMLPASEITPAVFDSFRKLEPFGTDNEEPFICTNGAELCEVRYMSEGKHARLTFKATGADGNNFFFNAIKFNCGGVPMPVPGEKCSILYKASVNVWQGRANAEPLIEDVYDGTFDIENETKKIYNNEYVSDAGFYLDRDTLAVLFKCLKTMGGRCGAKDVNSLKTRICNSGRNITRYQTVYGLQVFKELGFVTLSGGEFAIVPDAAPAKLEDSEMFRTLST